MNGHATRAIPSHVLSSWPLSPSLPKWSRSHHQLRLGLSPSVSTKHFQPQHFQGAEEALPVRGQISCCRARDKPLTPPPCTARRVLFVGVVSRHPHTHTHHHLKVTSGTYLPRRRVFFPLTRPKLTTRDEKGPSVQRRRMTTTLLVEIAPPILERAQQRSPLPFLL